MENLNAKIQGLIKSLNEKGVPLPILTDMVTGKPSLTYTMLLVTFGLTVLSLFNIGEIKLGLNFNQCLELLGYVGVGYIGRKYQKGSMVIEGKETGTNNG